MGLWDISAGAKSGKGTKIMAVATALVPALCTMFGIGDKLSAVIVGVMSMLAFWSAADDLIGAIRCGCKAFLAIGGREGGTYFLGSHVREKLRQHVNACGYN